LDLKPQHLHILRYRKAQPQGKGSLSCAVPRNDDSQLKANRDKLTNDLSLPTLLKVVAIPVLA
jgi:hypothetical protein